MASGSRSPCGRTAERRPRPRRWWRDRPDGVVFECSCTWWERTASTSHAARAGTATAMRVLFASDRVGSSWATGDQEMGGGRALDPVTMALQLAFYILFAVSVLQYLRRRGQLELSVVAIFGSIAALFFLTFVNALLPAVSPVARPALIAILFAQPYLIVRLINQIRPVSTIRMRIAQLASLASWETVVLLPIAIPDLKTVGSVFAVVCFAAVELAGATWFARHSRRRFGVARVRLASAAVATALFGASLLLAGLSSIGRPPNASAADSQSVTRL